MSPTWGEYLFFEISEGEHFPLCRCFSSSLLVIIVFTSPGGGGVAPFNYTPEYTPGYSKSYVIPDKAGFLLYEWCHNEMNIVQCTCM